MKLNGLRFDYNLTLPFFYNKSWVNGPTEFCNTSSFDKKQLSDIPESAQATIYFVTRRHSHSYAFTVFHFTVVILVRVLKWKKVDINRDIEIYWTICYHFSYNLYDVVLQVNKSLFIVC